MVRRTGGCERCISCGRCCANSECSVECGYRDGAHFARGRGYHCSYSSDYLSCVVRAGGLSCGYWCCYRAQHGYEYRSGRDLFCEPDLRGYLAVCRVNGLYIALLHIFRRVQKEVPSDPLRAMSVAMVRRFSVVLSSAAVTFFGLLSLTVMRFGIGVTMGIVLAKGISRFSRSCSLCPVKKSVMRTQNG